MKKTQETTAALTLKLSSIETLRRFLFMLPLQGQASRQRTQFCNLILPVSLEIEAKRKELLKKYADLDEKGEPKTYIDETDGGQEKFEISDENEKKFTEELTAFVSNDHTVNFDGDNIQLFNRIAQILSTSDYKFTGRDAIEFDLWMNALEK